MLSSQSTFSLFLTWNQCFEAYALHEIFPVALQPEINILTVFNVKSTFLCYALLLKLGTYVQDWTQLRILHILQFFISVAFVTKFVKLYNKFYDFS